MRKKVKHAVKHPLHNVCGLPTGGRTYISESAAYRRTHGFSLVELMVAMVLGLLVATAAMGIFASHRATYSKTSAVDRLQENARTAFELMARDIRLADNTPCRNALNLTKVEAMHTYDWQSPTAFSSTPLWLSRIDSRDFYKPDGTSEAGYGFTVYSIKNNEARVIDHDIKRTGNRKVSFKGDLQLKQGDWVLICDNDVGHTARVEDASNGEGGGSFTYQFKQFYHYDKNGGNDMNTIGKRDDDSCISSNYERGPFDPCNTRLAYQEAGRNGPAYVALIESQEWMVGPNDKGGKALYFLGSPSYQRLKIIDGIVNMQITYLWGDEADKKYLSFDEIKSDPMVCGPDTASGSGSPKKHSDCPERLRAIRIMMELESPDEAGRSDSVKRQFEYVVSLRNRSS